MPCTYDESPEERAYNEKQRFDNLKKELDLATRLLCEVCGDLEAADNRKPRPPILWSVELSEWWEKHKEMDRVRRKLEDKERRERLKEINAKMKELRKEAAKLGKKK